MKCPVCKEANLVMSERQGIEIDYCPERRSVWLDRGELDKFIKHAERLADHRPRGDAPERHDRDDEYRGKPRASLFCAICSTEGRT